VSTTSAALGALERLKLEGGPAAAARKSELLGVLERGRLDSAREVLRLHEVLCVMRAYPDGVDILRRVERMLGALPGRADLRRHARALAGSGVAGTEIRYRFFAETASWLAKRWGDRLGIEWARFDQAPRLARVLHLLASYSETPGLDGWERSPREWIRRMKGPLETDAAFVIRRFDALFRDGFVRETAYEELDIPIVLRPGRDTPARTREKLRRPRVFFQTRPVGTMDDVLGMSARPRVGRARGEADVPPALLRSIEASPRSIRPASSREAREIVQLARGAMVARNRDVDVFSYGDAGDVRIVDWGEGFEFAFIGAIPERRLLLEALSGWLALRNGVPIGYGTVSALYRSSEIAFNVFPSFRGAEAGVVLVRLLATARALFGSDTFTLDPYQLGEDNAEAIRSGAWWFYFKLGFRPRDPAVLGTMRREIARKRVRPGYRSSPGTLERLAAANVYLELGAPREDILSILPLADAGLAVTGFLGRRFGSDRERGIRECAREAARLLGVRSFAGWARSERLAWARWAPLVLLLPGVSRWSPANRRAAARVVRAKGGRRESDFVRLFDAHPRLPQALAGLANRGATGARGVPDPAAGRRSRAV